MDDFQRTRKERLAHRPPPPLALEIIEESIDQNKKTREILEDRDYSGYNFPGPTAPRTNRIERHALSKALKYNQSQDGLTVLGVASFTPTACAAQPPPSWLNPARWTR